VPLSVQEKILRVVEYGAFERVGSATPVEVDVRIVGATNADLRQLVREGRFMRDLLDRLAFEVLRLPPLRARQGDITLLARHFAGRMAFELGRESMPVFSPAAVRVLERHPWPGNIRELKNVVERAVYRSADDRIATVTLDPFDDPLPENAPQKTQSPTETPHPADQTSASALDTLPLKEAVARLQRARLRQALAATHYNQRRAAALLGLTYDQLRGLLRKFKQDL
jgi:psp operon transcriptional activator